MIVDWVSSIRQFLIFNHQFVTRQSAIANLQFSAAYLNEFSNRASIAFLPLSWIFRVPVPVKCGCVIVGTP